jgi:hypothetical protein
MLDDQFAAAMCRGQHEHHRREHAGGLLGIAVVDKEAAGIVDKKLIEVGRNRLAHTEPEGYVGDESGQGLFPVAPSDPNLGEIDLRSSPDFAIDQRLLAPPIGGCFGDCDEPGAAWTGRIGKAILPTPSISIVGMNISRIPPTQKSPGRSTERRLLSNVVPIDDMATPRHAGQCFVHDRHVDVLCLQEIIRSERTREKSRSCVTRAAALIANALAA